MLSGIINMLICKCFLAFRGGEWDSLFINLVLFTAMYTGYTSKTTFYCVLLYVTSSIVFHTSLVHQTFGATHGHTWPHGYTSSRVKTRIACC